MKPENYPTNKNQTVVIFGPAGSGKTTFGKKLSQKYNLPLLSLDEIVWQKKYTVKYNLVISKQLLTKFLQQNPTGWIIEGAEPALLKLAIPRADQTIWLQHNFFTLVRRLTKRYFQNRKRKEETLSALLKLYIGVILYRTKRGLYPLHSYLAGRDKLIS